jgi:hypothetical protein
VVVSQGEFLCVASINMQWSNSGQSEACMHMRECIFWMCRVSSCHHCVLQECYHVSDSQKNLSSNVTCWSEH